MHATTVAIDLAKDVFELGFADDQNRIVERRRLGRSAFARSLRDRVPLCVIMEACGSAHAWARTFERQGHRVRLLPAHDVRPYVRRNKTDRADVGGLLEAARCPDIHAVPVKSPQQQGVQALHRIREHLKASRTATINLIRGLLREFGIVIASGASKVHPAVLAALDDVDNEVPAALRDTLAEQLVRMQDLQRQVATIERRLAEFAERDAQSQRHLHAPGIGVITATAISASVGPLARFRSGRHFASWIGITPREHSSGNRRHLGRISKRGDSYLRMLLIHGARAALRSARIRQQHNTPLNRIEQWALSVQERQGHNKAAVALANKTARRLWASELHGARYDPNHGGRERGGTP